MSTQNIREYKPEIDGLRAIAVMAVLLFHLKVPGFSGGFVGVDIFFVISGFLITRNITDDLQTGLFSFKRFYTRRIRRLFPALLVTIAATLIASLFVLTPEHLSRLGVVSIASVFSFSNIMFWLESGYFDEAKAFKPLLHTWSLGVEEQFYLLWPLLLFLLFPFGKKVTLVLIILLGIITLAVTQSLLPQHSATAFYWMPLRTSEFAVGACLSFFVPGNRLLKFRTIGALAGLMLMVAPIFLYSESTTFPGVAAVIPCIGTALLICFGHAKATQFVLVNPLSRALGLMSYSLYLVHWPIIILVSYWKLGGIGFKSMIVIVPFIFLSAWLLYSQVEQRFRYPPTASSGSPFGLNTAAASLLVAALGASVYIGDGWMWRYSAEARLVINAVEGLSHDSEEKLKQIEVHQNAFRDNAVSDRHYIIGDSFAGDTFLVLKSAYPTLNLRLLKIQAECQPVLPGIYPEDLLAKHRREHCNRQRENVFHSPQLKQAKSIFLAASWREPATSNLAKAIKYLHENTSAKIIVFGPRANFHDVPTLAVRHGKNEGLEEFVDGYRLPGLDQMRAAYRHIAGQEGAQYIDVYELLCGSGLCPVISPQDGKIMYMDHAHFTMSGARYLGELLGDSDLSSSR